MEAQSIDYVMKKNVKASRERGVEEEDEMETGELSDKFLPFALLNSDEQSIGINGAKWAVKKADFAEVQLQTTQYKPTRSNSNKTSMAID
uniref:Uncharacterized protein n=1 Tax=Parascaris equorum TaxID=6256 RepID=A0A914RQM4_PAREQ